MALMIFRTFDTYKCPFALVDYTIVVADTHVEGNIDHMLGGIDKTHAVLTDPEQPCRHCVPPLAKPPTTTETPHASSVAWTWPWHSSSGRACTPAA